MYMYKWTSQRHRWTPCILLAQLDICCFSLTTSQPWTTSWTSNACFTATKIREGLLWKRRELCAESANGRWFCTKFKFYSAAHEARQRILHEWFVLLKSFNEQSSKTHTTVRVENAWTADLIFESRAKLNDKQSCWTSFWPANFIEHKKDYIYIWSA